MPVRFIHAAASLAILVVAYLGYAQVIVPLIEPDHSDQSIEQINQAMAEYEMPTERFRPLIEPLFSANDWESSPDVMIIASSDLLLLMKDYHRLENGQLHLNPCTVIQNSADSSGRTWMIQSEEGAVLKFDRQADPRSGQLGNMESGYLPGRVHITGSPTKPDAQDAIQFATTGVQLTPAAIATQHEVHFRFGHSFGTGRDLTIRLKQNPAESVQRIPNPTPTTVQSIELVHLDQATLFLPSQLAGPTRRFSQAAGPGLPVKVACDGPVVIDLEGGFASINQNVRVERERQGMTPEFLRCDQLAAFFRRIVNPVRPTDSQQAADHSNSGRLHGAFPKLELEKITATGEPAVLMTTTAADNGQQRWHQVTAANLQYDLNSPASGSPMPFGSLQANGAGDYQSGLAAHDRETHSTELQLAWRDQVVIQQSVAGSIQTVELNLIGQGLCEFQGMGRIRAEKMRVRLQDEQSSASPTPTNQSLKLEQIVAENQVRIETEQLVANTNRLNVSVQEVAALQSPVAGLRNAPASDANAGMLQLIPPEGAPDGIDGAANVSDQPKRHFQVDGELLNVVLARHQSDYEVQDLVLERNVRCIEVGNQGSVALEMTGDQLQLKHLSETGGLVAIQGSPAKIRARQLHVNGESIHLDRDQNELWITGAGSALLPLPSDMAKRYPNRPPTADVHWKGGMRFDGQMIQCKDRVMVRGPAQRLTTDELSAFLTYPVNFGTTKIHSDSIELESILATGNVDLENRTLDPAGLVSIDRAHLTRLQIKHATEEISGDGPGFIESVRRGNGKKDASLQFINVRFQQGFEGKLANKLVSFQDGVQALFGPVKNWEQRLMADKHETLLPQTVRMKCERLDVFQMPNQPPDAFELVATKNTYVEGKSTAGQLFAAQAHRLSYHQSKDLMMLQGDGRSDARLWHQPRVGAEWSQLPAQQIRYWPKANHVKIEGGAMLELNLDQ